MYRKREGWTCFLTVVLVACTPAAGFDLGGPCKDLGLSSPPDYYTEVREASMAAGDKRLDAFRERLDALGGEERPPEQYISKGACPFECCTYREWDVKEPTDLFDAPNGSVVVSSLVAGTKATAITGEVHVRPEPIAVIHDRPPFSAGDIFFLLDYLGEGFYRYWYDEEIGEDEILAEEHCLRGSKGCWAEYIRHRDDRSEPSWWVLIETPDGIRGWTDRNRHFGNMDGCGG